MFNALAPRYEKPYSFHILQLFMKHCMLCGNKDLCLYRLNYTLFSIVCFALDLQSYNTISQMISIRFSVIDIVRETLSEKTERVSIVRALTT